MMKKALKFTPGDNVAVALESLEAGDTLVINGAASDVAALEAVPQGHKVAMADIPEGAAIEKYGHVVGTATAAIPKGGYVHVHNVRDPISGWKSDLRDDYDPDSVTEISDEFLLPDPPKLTGYRRKDGSVGFRNYLLVLSTCACGNQPVDDLRIRMRNCPEVVCVTNPSGCVILPNDEIGRAHV